MKWNCVFVQTLLPGLSVSGGSEVKSSSTAAESSERVYAHQMVRTDCRAQKLDAFLQPKEKLPADPEPAGSSCREAVTETAQTNGAEMDETDDAEMLEALADQEADVPNGNDDNANGIQRWLISFHKRIMSVSYGRWGDRCVWVWVDVRGCVWVCVCHHHP